MRIAAIGDLHVQETDESPYRELFTEISSHADVLLRVVGLLVEPLLRARARKHRERGAEDDQRDHRRDGELDHREPALVLEAAHGVGTAATNGDSR